MKKSYSQREWILVGAMMLFVLALGFLPTGFEQEIYVNAVGSKARVISVDNTDLY
ncbi:MAG: YibE/F family protein, partial [Spirochaetia bacterium]|nr:YibE/F family protein [Spirochaetia bacterium]